MVKSVGEHVRDALDKAREIDVHYMESVPVGPHAKKSIDDFLEVCQQYTGAKISVHDVKYSGATKSACFAGTDKASYEIYIGPTENTLWYRFYLCKELFHVLLDTEDGHCIDLYEHLEQFLSASIVADLRQSTLWEHIAMAAAVEFMFPYQDRVAILKENAAPNFDALSEQYGLPRPVIEGYLSATSMEVFHTYRGSDT